MSDNEKIVLLGIVLFLIWLPQGSAQTKVTWFNPDTGQLEPLPNDV